MKPQEPQNEKLDFVACFNLLIAKTVKERKLSRKTQTSDSPWSPSRASFISSGVRVHKRFGDPCDAEDYGRTLRVNTAGKFGFVAHHKREPRLGNINIEFRTGGEDAIFEAA